MNDEQGYTPPEQGSERGSRWAVQPGSISDSVTFRRPESFDDEPRRRRSASEIIREVRGEADLEHDDRPTRISERRPSVPTDLEPTPRSSHSEGHHVARSGRSPLYDERSRVEPDLGEKRELRAAYGGSSSSLVMAGFGGVALIAVGGLIGAVLDYLFDARIGVLTIIGLTLGAASAAAVTRKRDLVSVMVAAPLVYAVIAAVVLLVSGKAVHLTTIADLAIRGFPAMALAAGVAALIGGLRLIGSRSGERR